MAIDRNVRTALFATAAVFGMTGVGFASVPLYRVFCQVTGFGGTTQVADAAPGATAGRVTVAFDSNVSPALPWKFAPEQRTAKVALGERNMAFFTARNDSDRPVTGTATFNVTPAQAGRYFAKIQCFCFTEQVLQPGEEMRMPVIYYVDPALATDPDAKSVQEITLSYTFYPVDSAKTAS
ncbi:cytochrome c oxidase assembly protein [Sphingomonas baiyangensis]|uniref:Cytochrome c oxidase assembly protein CtaG n=1 Tax=Sphingomonas baiyangensis TaxID=2572576 RepID=A0A4U1L1C0_9SPHN|nr:cytochrome c oxidase assembly protein [Sphingomonas baiyangensis]TKD50392.1 cytochrome c oxidase assembly protein [Sphingomonas baiyangensis]